MVNGSKSLVQEQMRFGAWNFRTMSGREIELVEEMKKYRLELLGVSEAKVRGMVKRRLVMLGVYFRGYRQAEQEQVWRYSCQKGWAGV